MSSNFSKRTRFAMQTGALDQRSDLVDTRSIFSFLFDYMPILISGIFACVGILVILNPEYATFLFIAGFPLLAYGLSVQMDYLISAPMANNRKKANGKRKKEYKRGKSSEGAKSGLRLKFGDALMLIGYDLLFGRQMWIDVDRETRMGLISGTTGSGKTVTLNSQLFQSCIQGHLRGGAPVLLGDGKGSVDGLYDFLFYIARTGRIDCVRIMNFLTGGATHKPDAMLDEHYPSNKFNIFSDTNPDESRGVVMGFGKAGEGGNSDYFRDRASDMLAGSFPPLCYLRDECGENLDISVLQQNLGLREMIKLASRKDIPKPITKPLREYLKTLNQITDAHFASDSGEVEINQKADEQHTYNKSMVSKTVNEMAGTFGHIFSSVGSDINTRNVIQHGQILLVLLPTIEKEPDSMQELGRMFIGSLRPAFASLFGYRIQGLRKEIIHARKRLVPVRVFLDEVLNYYQRGLSQFLSLMRDRTVSLVLLGQSMKGMEDAGVSEARQSTANLNNKYMFGSQDVYETYELLSKTLGKMRVKRLSEKVQTVWGNWTNADRMQDVEENILEERDIASADPMEGVYLYRGQPTPFMSATFFPDDERDGKLDRFYLNHYAELEYPTQAHIDHVRAIMGLESALQNGEKEAIDPEVNFNAITSSLVEKVETVCSNIRDAGKEDVYRSFDALVYAMIDDIVNIDLEAVAEAQQALVDEADEERQQIINSRSSDELMDINNADSMIVDSNDLYGSHSAMYGDVLGVGNYESPNFDEDEDGDDSGSYSTTTATQPPPTKSSSATNGEKGSDSAQSSSKASTGSAKSGSFLSKDKVAGMAASMPPVVPNYGELTTEPENNQTSKSDATKVANPLEGESAKAIADDVAKVTSINVETVTQELLNVKVYPSEKTPPILSESEQASLTHDVSGDMDDAEARLRKDLETKTESALDNLFS